MKNGEQYLLKIIGQNATLLILAACVLVKTAKAENDLKDDSQSMQTAKSMMLLLNEQNSAANRLIEQCSSLPDIAYDAEKNIVIVLDAENEMIRPIVHLKSSVAMKDKKPDVLCQYGNTILLGGHKISNNPNMAKIVAITKIYNSTNIRQHNKAQFKILLSDNSYREIEFRYSVTEGTKIFEGAITATSKEKGSEKVSVPQKVSVQ